MNKLMRLKKKKNLLMSVTLITNVCSCSNDAERNVKSLETYRLTPVLN